jgi:hypothetical protein
MGSKGEFAKQVGQHRRLTDRCSTMGPKEAKELCPHVMIVHTATYRPGETESGYWDDADVLTHKVSQSIALPPH